MVDILKYLLFPFSRGGAINAAEPTRKLLWFMVIGLVPSMLMKFKWGLKPSLWILALYSALILLVFFYHAIRPSQISIYKVCFLFFATGLSAIYLVDPLIDNGPLKIMYVWQASPNEWFRLLGHSTAALLEELWKLILPCMIGAAFSKASPREIVFYGLVSGLGFGMFEGVMYQLDRNTQLANGDPLTFYLLNIFRVTSAPFMHAIWAGIATLLVGVAMLHRRLIIPMFGLGLTLSSVLHGVENHLIFEHPDMQLYIFALEVFSVVVFCSYATRLATFDHLMSRR